MLSTTKTSQQEMHTIGDHLRRWRKIRRFSQLDLALQAGISARHLSFIETGRARAGEETVLALARALQLPLRHQNGLLQAAGYAPRFAARPLNSPEMALIQQALQHMLTHHDPLPAAVVSSRYEILRYNAGFARVVELFAGPGALEQYPNLYQLVFATDGLKPAFANWNLVSALLRQRLFEEAAATQYPELWTLYESLNAGQKTPRPAPRLNQAADLPFLHFTLQNDETRLSFFSTMTTFGLPMDVRLQELRLDLLFPVDVQTQSFFNS